MGDARGAATITQRTGARTFQVFLSSTVRDLEKYREEVQDALIKKAQIACFPSEEWTGGHAYVPTLVKQRLGQADGYFLIVGYWYGSVPPNETKSITHMEYEWAKEQWKDSEDPPIAVFMPKIDSNADRELHEAADALLAAIKSRELYETCIRNFRDALQQTWLKVQEFTDRQDLRERALVLSKDWQAPLMLVASGKVPAPQSDRVGARLTDAMLGSIGRADHYATVRKILNRVNLAPAVPAVAILVTGEESAGQAEFLQWVVQHKEIPGSKKSIGQPSVDGYDLNVLCKWVAEALGLRAVSPVSPTELADALSGILQEQPLFFGLNRVSRLPGGAAAFQKDFWAPLYARLHELKRERQFRYRLIAFVTNFSGHAASFGDSVTDEKGQDYSRLLAIPRLGDLAAEDISEWLSDQGVEDNPPGRYRAIATRVLKNDAGQDDSRAVFVFRRLRDENLEL